jgi:hypothetical protein
LTQRMPKEPDQPDKNMAIEIKHQRHIFTYRHPIGWTGGNESVCKKLNCHQTCPGGNSSRGRNHRSRKRKTPVSERRKRHRGRGCLAGRIGPRPRSDPRGYSRVGSLRRAHWLPERIIGRLSSRFSRITSQVAVGNPIELTPSPRPTRPTLPWQPWRHSRSSRRE